MWKLGGRGARRAILLHVSRNPDEAKTQTGLWVANTRKALNLSVPALASASGYSVSTIAKVEGGSNPKPSPAFVSAMFKAFRRLGAEHGVAVSEPPAYASAEGTTDLAALIAAMDRQTTAIGDLAATIWGLLSIDIKPDTPEIAEARRILRESYLYGGAVESGADEGVRRSRAGEDRDSPARSPERPAPAAR